MSLTVVVLSGKAWYEAYEASPPSSLCKAHWYGHAHHTRRGGGRVPGFPQGLNLVEGRSRTARGQKHAHRGSFHWSGLGKAKKQKRPHQGHDLFIHQRLDTSQGAESTKHRPSVTLWSRINEEDLRIEWAALIVPEAR